jgi:hypothetical protein
MTQLMLQLSVDQNASDYAKDMLKVPTAGVPRDSPPDDRRAAHAKGKRKSREADALRSEARDGSGWGKQERVEGQRRKQKRAEEDADTREKAAARGSAGGGKTVPVCRPHTPGWDDISWRVIP